MNAIRTSWLIKWTDFCCPFQSGVVRRTNLAIERHASKVCTKAMSEQFGERLFEAIAYKVTELEKGRRYLSTHNNAAKREWWSRVMYEVMIKDEDAKFECECGQFEHTGMLCCHVFRVRSVLCM